MGGMCGGNNLLASMTVADVLEEPAATSNLPSQMLKCRADCADCEVAYELWSTTTIIPHQRQLLFPIRFQISTLF
ncbi:MAG: hypothetical protein GY822_01985 [Deltaproteobacteria bacterium]|nr:hypothetical protein [Deltaproteobacteria bacterium]